MGLPGRKSATEELQIVKRYSELSVPFFKVLIEALNKKPAKNATAEKQKQIHDDRKWAVEQLNKAYVKMIPQQVGGDPNNPLTLMFDSSFKNETPPTPKKNSKKSS